MATIGIVGLGAMGLGIAQVFAQAGHSVIGTDANVEARDRAVLRISEKLSPRVATAKMTPEEMERTCSAIRIVDSVADVVDADLAIEAIVENLEAKQSILATLCKASPGAVLATNTSALSVSDIAAALPEPSRLVGLHFFNPAPVMALVELISHEGTDPAIRDRARSLTGTTGKTVIGCADMPGFIVNRCARPFYGEALAMIAEGRWPSQIDAAMLAAGYKMGPFTLIDLIGADVHLAATEAIYDAMDKNPRYYVFPRLRQIVGNGALGRKVGLGFLFPDAPGRAPPDAEQIALRIESTLANEAAYLVDAGGATPDDIDTAMRLGMNFPRGPFESARAHGIGKVLETLAALEAQAAKERPVLAGRYIPSPTLVAMA